MSYLMKETTHEMYLPYDSRGMEVRTRVTLVGSRNRQNDLPEGGTKECWGADNVGCTHRQKSPDCTTAHLRYAYFTANYSSKK